MKLNKALALFADYASEKYTPRTIEVYMGNLRQFQKHIGNKNVERISLFDDIISYSQHLRRTGRQPATVNLCMTALRQLWHMLFLLERQFNLTLPFRPLAIPIRKLTITRSHQAITEKDYKRLMRAIESMEPLRPFVRIRDLAIYSLLYDTGLRVNELTGLNIDQLDMVRRSLEVVTEKRRDANKRREVYWTLSTHYFLSKYLEARKEVTGREELFVNSREFKRITSKSIQRNMKVYLKEAGIDPGKYSPHSFRHGVGMRAASKQMYPPLLQQYLGHISPNNTQVYFNLQNEDLRKEWAAKLGDKSTGSMVGQVVTSSELVS